MFMDGITTYSYDTLVAGLVLQSTLVDWWCYIGFMASQILASTYWWSLQGYSSLLKESSIHFGSVSISHTCNCKNGIPKVPIHVNQAWQKLNPCLAQALVWK